MAKEKDFTDLIVWQKSHDLVLKIYKLIKLLPGEEKYNLIDQIRRSSSSICANIAEGYGRFYYQDNISFCRKARGSLDETRNHLMQIKDLNLASKDDCENLLDNCEEVRRLINGLISYLQKQKPR